MNQNWTNLEKFQYLEKYIQSIDTNLHKIHSTTGISKNILDKHIDYWKEIQNLRTKIGTTWTNIQNSNQSNNNSNSFDLFEEPLTDLYVKINQLYRQTEKESGFSTIIKDVFNIEKNDFLAARAHHKFHSNLTLILLFLVSLGSGLFIWEAFINLKDETDNYENLVKLLPILSSQLDFLKNIIFTKLLLKITGRFSIVAILTWLIIFIGKLHSKHNKQYILYQDKVSGLNAAEIIITSGGMETREKILLEMTDTYLTLKNNAFDDNNSKEISLNKSLLNSIKRKLQSIESKIDKH